MFFVGFVCRDAMHAPSVCRWTHHFHIR